MIHASQDPRRRGFASAGTLLLVPCFIAVLAFRTLEAATVPGGRPSVDPQVDELLRTSPKTVEANRGTLFPALRHDESGIQWVDLLLRGDVSSLDIERLGGQVGTVAGSIRTVHLPLSALPQLVQLTGVEQVQAAQGLQLETNVSIPEIGANQLWGGTPPNFPAPPTGNTGRGVVVGLID